MVVLKKIKGSTLLETLVATVIIILVFVLATKILNWMFYSAVKSDFNTLNVRLNELEYKLINQEIKSPYWEDHGDYEISILQVKKDNNKYNIEVENIKTNKTISRIFEY